MKHAAMRDAVEMVVMGRVIGVHGVDGWLKVFSFTDPRERICSYRSWRLSHRGASQTSEVIDYRLQGKKLIVRIDGCGSRNDAELLIGAEIAVPETKLAELPPGEYYWRQLEGLEVVNLGGDRIGTVKELLETGANDVLVVSLEGRESDCLIPWVMTAVVKSVDLEQQRITVDWQADW